jgi:dipeptidyl aminopeptidase/acylaminoacyl peptidase
MQKFFEWMLSLFASTAILVNPTSQPMATPFPFEELTIPYLRLREYKSSLGEMNKYQEKANYTSYLTSYDSDGLKVNGLLTIPKGESSGKGFPAVVFVHGYIAPGIYKTTEKYVDYVDYLAKNGFVVFKIDLRGHGDSEGEAGGSYYSGDYVIDTLNAYSALGNAGFVDKEKIYLWGHSMAGNIVFRSLAVKKDIPKVVIWAGAGYTYNDLLAYKLNDQSYRPPQDNTARQRKRQELREKYGEFNENSDFWKQVVPTNYLDGVKTEISLHHAVDDNVVSVEYSRNLNRILDETDIAHELNEYPSGGHNINGLNFTKAMERTVEFYK